MKFLLEMKTDNAAFDTLDEDEQFQGVDGAEVATILRDLADRIDDTRLAKGRTGSLADSNGNTVGSWKMTKR